MTHDLDQMAAELATLRAQVAQLTAHQQDASPDDPAVSRRHLLRGLAGLGAAGAATAAGIATADPAAAADGDPLILGQDNTATGTTSLTAESLDGLHVTSVHGSGLRVVAAGDGVHSSGIRAVLGFGQFVGVGGTATGGGGVGVYATADPGGRALISESVAGPAIEARSDDGIALLLVPTTQPGPPTAACPEGSFAVDVDREVWLKVGDGTPGTWTRLLREDTAAGRVVPITPLRVLDTRTATGQATGGPVVPGQIKGPLKGGQTLTLPLAGITPIPTTATGIVGNATVITPTGTGYLRLLPAGATTPASSFNFTNGTTIANGFTSALAPTGLSAIAPISPTITYHLVLDIAAYIT